MTDENEEMLFKLRKEALNYYPSPPQDVLDAEKRRRDLARPFVEIFKQGDDKDKIKAVAFLLEAIEGRIKEEIKRI
jgi:hypothetical protein